MKKSVTQYFTLLKEDKETFLNYLKARFPLFHNSNFFFRDLQYGIKGYFEKKNYNITYADAEVLAVQIAEVLESEKFFVRINQQGWKINNPEYVTAKPGDPF